MREEYQPSTREICAEIWHEFDSTYKGDFLRAGNAFKQFGFLSVGFGGLIALGPYAIPTLIRTMNGERLFTDGKYPSVERFGSLIGAAIGVSAIIGQTVGYNYLATHDHPEALAIPIATNIVSGIYELGRKSYRSARQRLLERHSREISDTLSDTMQ